MSQQSGEVAWRIRPMAIRRALPWPAALAFSTAFAAMLAIALLQGEKPFYFDSGEYWGLGATFTVHGHFSLLNFSSATRGYLLPLISHGLKSLATDLTWTASSMAKLVNALTFALIGTVLAPALTKTVWPKQPSWGAGRRLALSALLVVFWSGYLNFPLSDFPGVAMALLTVVAVARIDSPGWMLTAGLALGMSINMRAAYLPFAPVVAALVAWAWYDQRGTQHASAAHRLLCAGLLTIGFAAVSLPQSLSAHRYHGTWSFVPSASTFEPAGVFLTPGMVIQSRDTYVGRGGTLVLNYAYPAGQRLLAEQPEGRIASTGQYIGLFATHPLVMGGLVIGHIINNLDPLYSTPYIENLHNIGRVWGRIAAFLLAFMALLRVLWPAARRLLGPGRLRYLLALGACCVTTIPAGMERRYLLPVYVSIYALALTPRWPNPMRSSESGWRRARTPAVLAVAFAVFAGVVWYFTNEAIANLRLTG
jgi:hypothetical protein